MTPLQTLGNVEWLRENEAKLKEMLPETWTNISNLDYIKIGFHLKLLGVDWRSIDELGSVMAFLEEAGIIHRKEYLVRRNPKSIFPNENKSRKTGASYPDQGQDPP